MFSVLKMRKYINYQSKLNNNIFNSYGIMYYKTKEEYENE